MHPFCCGVHAVQKYNIYDIYYYKLDVLSLRATLKFQKFDVGMFWIRFFYLQTQHGVSLGLCLKIQRIGWNMSAGSDFTLRPRERSVVAKAYTQQWGLNSFGFSRCWSDSEENTLNQLMRKHFRCNLEDWLMLNARRIPSRLRTLPTARVAKFVSPSLLIFTS